MLKASLAHIGHTTVADAKKTKNFIAKYLNQLPQNHLMRHDFFSALMQLEMRNISLENSFFIIDWNIILAVSIEFF
jgi:hypothetical protein